MRNMTGRSLVFKYVPVIAVLGAMLLSTVLMVPATVSADATHPKWVNGYVMDLMGRRLAGASVTVTIDGNTKAETSNSEGFFQVQFTMTEWTVGSNIHVTATYNSQQAWNDSLADDSFVQEVNVEFPYEIPQFGSSFGLLLAGGFVAAVSMVLLADKKRR